MFVYDSTNKETFIGLAKWMTECQQYIQNNAVKIIIANKSDLNTIISKDQAEQFANSNNVKLFETSAKTGNGINEAFQYLIDEICNHLPSQSSPDVSIDVDQQNSSSSSCC